MKHQMRVNVKVCNDSGNEMVTESERITEFLRKNTNVQDICADGIRLHSSVPVVDRVCDICLIYGLPFRRIDNWNVRVGMKDAADGFGVYFS